MFNTHIKLTSDHGYTLILPKKDICVSMSPAGTARYGVPYVFNIATPDDGWLVTEPLSYVLDELGISND